MTSYTKNFVIDYGAPTDGGITAADTALDNWNDFLETLTAGDTVTFTIPNAGAGGSNTYRFTGDVAPWRGSLLHGVVGGISITVECAGVSFTGNFGLGHWRAIFDDNVHSARIATVSSGSSSIRFLDLADLSKISVGRILIVGGIDLQGIGSPPNNRIFDHVRVTAIDGGTGVVSIDPPLTHIYSSSWPLYNAGSGSDPDEGGPATAFIPETGYDVAATYNASGASFSVASGTSQIYGKCRSIIINGSPTFAGPGFVPTVSAYTELNGTNNTAEETEFDKLTGIIVSTGSHWRSIKAQSGVADLRISGDTVDLDVQPSRKTSIVASSIGRELYTGPISFGWCEQLTVTNSSIVGPLHDPGLTDTISDWTWMGGGLFRRVKTSSPTRLSAIGAWFTFTGSRNFGRPFRIIDAYSDATYEYVQTTLTSFPTFNMSGSGFTCTNFGLIPCLSATLSGTTTSDLDILALNNAPAAKPFWSYNERTFSGAYNGSTALSMNAVGQIQRIVIDVQRAYTGAQSTCRLLIDQSGVFLMDSTDTLIRPSGYYVNLKVAGTRTITPTSITGTQAGDNLPVSGSTYDGWMVDAIAPMQTADTTGDSGSQQAITRFQIYTDQGVSVSLPFGRLGLRLRQ